MPVAFPPPPQLRDHGRGQRHETIFAAFAAAHVQTGLRCAGLAQIADLNPHRFTDAQAGVIDEAQRGAIARLLHRSEQRGHLFARQYQRQGLRRRDAHLLEDRPAGDVEAVTEETAQGAPGELHGRAAELLLLAQEQEVSAQLILGQRGRVALVMLAQLAYVTDVFVLGGLAIIFELDKVRELCQGWISRDGRVNHRAGSVPVSAVTRSPPTQKTLRPPQPMNRSRPQFVRQACRKAAGFNQGAAAPMRVVNRGQPVF